MSTQLTCSKCNTKTYRIQRLANNRFIYLCKEHNNIESDRELLKANKKATTDYYIKQQKDTVPENLLKLMTDLNNNVTSREVYTQIASGKKIEPITEEELKKQYDLFQEQNKIKKR